MSLDEEVFDRGETYLDLLSEVGTIGVNLNTLDEQIAVLQATADREVASEIEAWIELDPERQLQNCHPRSRSGCHCQILSYLNEQLTSVELLGFIDAVQPRLSQPATTETIAIESAEIQSIDRLLDLIYDRRAYHLQEFLAGILGTGWEPIRQQRSAQMDSTNREFALRNTLNLANNTNYDSIRDFTASKMINHRLISKSRCG